MAPKVNVEPMELAKNYDSKKSLFPAVAQVKYDGVPLTFILKDGQIQALTRQNEVVTSVPHLVAAASIYLRVEGASFTGECFVPGKSFKVSSGIIRREEPCEDVICIVFDANIFPSRKHGYNDRRIQWIQCYNADANKFQHKFFFAPIAAWVNSPAEVEDAWVKVKTMAKNPEGMMLHAVDKPFQPGKRCWGMTRYKPQPTIDLRIDSFEEAISEEGEPLGMVGRVNVELERRYPSGMIRRTIVGVGPGKLTHYERNNLWQKYAQYLGKVVDKVFAEIKYMPDPTYDALRQPTVQRLRTDKDKPDVLEYSNE